MLRHRRRPEGPVQTTTRVIRSAIAAAASAGVGAVGGALGLGLLAYSRTSKAIREDRIAFGQHTPDAEQTVERDKLLSAVKNSSRIRHVSKMINDQATQQEFDARKKLEAMGYLPCSECGRFHPGQHDPDEDLDGKRVGREDEDDDDPDDDEDQVH